MKFCDRMNELLTEKGWKQADLVRASGMSDAQVYHLCSGRSKNPKLTTLLILMNSFNVTLDELVKGVDLPLDEVQK
jgi:transcriptional regulator with XRE-family HTH domain